MGRQSSADESRVNSSARCRTTQPGRVSEEQRSSPVIVTINMPQATTRWNDTGFALDNMHLAQVRYVLEKRLGRAQRRGRIKCTGMACHTERDNIPMRSQPHTIAWSQLMAHHEVEGLTVQGDTFYQPFRSGEETRILIQLQALRYS